MSDNLDNQVEYVRSLAIAFRMAIGRAQESGELSRTVIATFPIGCCGYTSDLLKRYLDEHDIKTWYVSGTYRSSTNDSQSHAWLELADGTVIDITGDQFRFELYPLQNDCPVYCDKPNEFTISSNLPRPVNARAPIQWISNAKKSWRTILSASIFRSARPHLYSCAICMSNFRRA